MTPTAWKDLEPGAAARRGAAQGFAAWAIYALAEIFFTSVLPWLVKPSYSYTPVHRGFTLLLLTLLPLVGAAAGAVTGVLLRGLGRTAAPVAGTVSMVLAFGLNLAHLLTAARFSFEGSAMHLVLPLALCIVPLGAAIAALRSDAAERRFGFLARPGTAAFLLVGLPWVTVHWLSTSTRALKTAGTVLFPVLIVVLALALRRIPRGAARGFGIGAGALVLAGAMLFTHTPEILAPPPPVLADAPRTNVVLVILDTVRANHMSVYGYERETTPEVEEFAGGATLYTRAISSGDMTLTTHASLFTGLYGRTHGAHRSPVTPAGRPLSSTFRTLAEDLAEAGYWNVAVVSNRGYVTPHFGMDQGFHSFDSRGPVPFLGHPPPYYLRRGVRALLVPWVPRPAFDRVTRSADTIHEESVRQLDRAIERGGPFFLFVNYMDAHNPYLPPAPFDTMWPGKDPDFTSVDYGRLLWAVNRQGKRELTESERAHLVSQYDGGIAYVDSRFGMLIDRLRELGVYDDTLILVTSDHGEALGERSLVNHGVSVYQDQVYVPLLVKFPGQTAGSVVDAWTSSVDLLPTVLDVLGRDAPPGIAGESLRGITSGTDRMVVAESFPTGPRARFNRMERALFLGRHKLVRNSDGKKELFDLVADPEETRNLFGTSPLGDSLEARLDAWLDTTVVRADSAVGALDPEMQERLRALGYLE